ncbi:hypothetical protein SAMN06272775_2432 [Streptomyces sp. 2323.1]|nr:hypothetical protein SAMN06272775_2432 [Streptomyces sp. 2323.1]
MATRLPKGRWWGGQPLRDGTLDGRSTSLRGGRRRAAATGTGRAPAVPPRGANSAQARPKRVSRNRLIPLSGLPWPGGATRSAHAPGQSAAVRLPARGPRRPAPAPRGGRGTRPRRRLSLRDAGLRVHVRARLRAGGRPCRGAWSRTGRGRAGTHPGGRRRGPRPVTARILDRLPGAAAAAARPAAGPAAPGAGGPAHRPRLLAPGNAGAAGVRLPGPVAAGRRAERVRRLLPAGGRRRGGVGQAVRPGLCARHAADRVHARRAADPARRGRVRRPADGPVHRPGAERGLALCGHADLRAARTGPPGADHRPSSGRPTGESTAERTARAAGPADGAACGPGAPAAREPSAAGGSPARTACAAIAAPTIPALF